MERSALWDCLKYEYGSGLSLLVSNAGLLVCPNKRLSRSPEMSKECRCRTVKVPRWAGKVGAGRLTKNPALTLRGVAKFRDVR